MLAGSVGLHGADETNTTDDKEAVAAALTAPVESAVFAETEEDVEQNDTLALPATPQANAREVHTLLLLQQRNEAAETPGMTFARIAKELANTEADEGEETPSLDLFLLDRASETAEREPAFALDPTLEAAMEDVNQPEDETPPEAPEMAETPAFETIFDEAEAFLSLGRPLEATPSFRPHQRLCRKQPSRNQSSCA